MPIPFTKYIDINSSVGGAAAAAQRELMLRLFTTNPLVPTSGILEFSNLASVGDHFGTTSEEYLEAVFYFGFISKLSTAPRSISYARWADAATLPSVFGIPAVYSLGDFTAISDGTISVTFGAITEDIAGINLSGAADLDAVAAIMQVDIRAANVDTQFAACAVAFVPATGRFTLVGGGTPGVAAMVIADGASGTQLAPVLGWEGLGVVVSAGVAIQTITDVLTSTTQASNNFGSYSFVPTLDDAEKLESATWAHGENVTFMYLEKVNAADAASLVASLANFSGTALTLYDPTLVPIEYPWLAPGALMAATPYEKRNAAQNYMYQKFTLTPSVTTSALSDSYDALKVNYYGQTQQAGSLIAFYQRGFLMGDSDAPTDMGVFANEIFLKDSVGASIMNLLLAVGQVPANASGIAQVLAVVQASIDQGIFNGTISIGKTFTAVQKVYIEQVTGDDTAFLQIQSAGYWISAVITEPTTGDFVVSYTLLYSKADSIRKVEGSHTLI